MQTNLPVQTMKNSIWIIGSISKGHGGLVLFSNTNFNLPPPFLGNFPFGLRSTRWRSLCRRAGSVKIPSWGNTTTPTTAWPHGSFSEVSLRLARPQADCPRRLDVLFRVRASIYTHGLCRACLAPWQTGSLNPSHESVRWGSVTLQFVGLAWELFGSDTSVIACQDLVVSRSLGCKWVLGGWLDSCCCCLHWWSSE